MVIPPPLITDTGNYLLHMPSLRHGQSDGREFHAPGIHALSVGVPADDRSIRVISPMMNCPTCIPMQTCAIRSECDVVGDRAIGHPGILSKAAS